jgi:hypothetical protein
MKNLLPLLFLTLVACKKEPEPEPPVVTPPAAHGGTVKFIFENQVGGDSLQFDKTYLTAAGDSFTVSRFNYYISNIALVSSSSYFPQPESYFVMRHPAQRNIDVTSVHSQTYIAVEFIIGVDSARNCSGAQTGGLDPAVNKDMYWSWNTGYIFLKLEGKAPTSPAATKALTYHVGGFKGEYNAIRKVVLDCSANPIIVKDNSTSTVRIRAEVLDMFRGPLELRFSDFNYQMNPGEGAKKFADNYADMFSIKSVQN